MGWMNRFYVWWYDEDTRIRLSTKYKVIPKWVSSRGRGQYIIMMCVEDVWVPLKIFYSFWEDSGWAVAYFNSVEIAEDEFLAARKKVTREWEEKMRFNTRCLKEKIEVRPLR